MADTLKACKDFVDLLTHGSFSQQLGIMLLLYLTCLLSDEDVVYSAVCSGTSLTVIPIPTKYDVEGAQFCVYLGAGQRQLYTWTQGFLSLT